MSNPYKTQPGFNLRLNYAVNTIRALGRDPLPGQYFERVFNNRKFDNCFESNDGDAIVYAIMEKAFEHGDTDLIKGIHAMGETLYAQWTEHYHQAKNRQLSFFF